MDIEAHFSPMYCLVLPIFNIFLQKFSRIIIRTFNNVLA